MLAPPYSSATVMPSTPSSPIFSHRSIGNWSLRSISAARGAISAWANACTASRSASMSSPSMKFRPGRLFISRLLGEFGAWPALGSGSLVDVYVNVNQTRLSGPRRALAGRWGTAGRLGCRGGLEQPLAARLVLRDLFQRHADVVKLQLDLLAMGAQHREERLELRRGVRRRVVHVDQLLDLLQAQAQALAAQRELEAGALALRIHAVAAGALRLQQADVLVE